MVWDIHLFTCMSPPIRLAQFVLTHIYRPLYWFSAHSTESFPISRDVGGVIARWVYDIWIYGLVVSLVLGILIGYGARLSLRMAERRGWLDGER